MKPTRLPGPIAALQLFFGTTANHGITGTGDRGRSCGVELGTSF